MSDDRVAEIDRKIDRGIAGAVALSQHGVGAVIAPSSMSEAMELAKLIAISGVCVRPVFRGNPGACLAIVLQALKWGADPFAVANKAYVVKSNKTGEETLAYEAQLVHAIVNSSPVLERRLRPVFEGEGGKRRCRIVGMVKGEVEPLEYESPPIEKIGVKNSPLWVSDPDQQLFYYSTRAWARRHVPEVLLGIYAPEEFTGETIDLTPTPEPRREDFIDARPEPQPEPQRYAVVDTDGVEHTFSRLPLAVDGLRAVLGDAAKAGVAALDGMWESNQALIETLRESDLDDTADELVAEFAQLRDQAKPKPAATRNRKTVEQTPAGDEPAGQRLGLGVADAQGAPQASEARDPSAGPTEPEHAHSAPRGATASPAGDPQPTNQERTTEAAGSGPHHSDHQPAGDTIEQNRAPDQRAPALPAHPPADQGRDQHDDDRFPGDLPQGERTQAGAQLGTSPADMGGSSAPTAAAPANSSAGRGPAATTAASRSDDRPSKRIAQPAGGLRIWWIALMGPKVRRERDQTELAFLLGDNEETLDACRHPGAMGRDELAELEKDIADAWERCK